MKITSFFYFFRQAAKSIARNPWMSIASAGTVAVSLFICGLFFLLVLNTNNIAGTLESGVEISVFLNPETSYEDVKAAGQKLTEMQGVKDVAFISKEAAMLNLQKQFAGKANLIKAIGTDNPLPDAYTVKVEKPENVTNVAKSAQNISGVWKVNYGQGVVEKMFAVVKWVRGIGLVLMLLLAAGALFLISTTIRLTIHTRKREISIMKYVGATEWFVRWPFLLEGMILGFCGTLVSVIALFFVYNGIINNLGSAMAFLPLIKDVSVVLTVSEVLLVGGTLLGAAGSFMSMRKYLRA